MRDPNQPEPPGEPLSAAPLPVPPPAAALGDGWRLTQAELSPFAPHPRIPLGRALILWLAILVVFGAGGMLLGQQEMALLAAGSGILIAAHAADLDRGWRELYYALGWVVPAIGFLMSFAIGAAIWQGDLPGFARAVLVVVCSFAAGLAVLSVPTPVGDFMARTLFRAEKPGHLLRVTARVVVMTLALVVPGWFAAQRVLGTLIDQPGALMDQAGLSGGLIGYVILAFAGVGWMIRRDLRASIERLGLRVPRLGDLAIALLALGGLWLLNNGADWLQQRWFPALWASDQRMTKAIASGMSTPQVVLLALSAGIGEEITMRGGLQPRLGIVLTSAFFAALHVQYSWFGMAVIFVLGMVLGTVRQRASTTAAILAHVAYDVIAVLGQ